MFENKTILKNLTLAGVAALCLTVGSTAMQAAEITVAGSTTGSIGGSPVGCAETFQGLAFACSSFTTTTVGGFAAVGGVGGGNNNLGSVMLSTSTFTYSAVPFSLKVMFTAPSGIVAGNPATYSAVVSGAVNSTNNGGVFIDFNNTPQLFSFHNATSSGTFSLSLNDVSINPGQTVTLTGNILGQAAAGDQTPEPASMALMGLGLVAVGFASRKIRAARS